MKRASIGSPATPTGLEHAAPEPRRRSWWRRWLSRLFWFVASLLLLLMVFVFAFIASPFERGLDRDIGDLVPARTPVFLRAHDLSASYERVKASLLWKHLVVRQEWKELLPVPGPDARGPDPLKQFRADARTVFDLFQSKPELGLALETCLRDLLGADSAVAIYPPELSPAKRPPGAPAPSQELDATLYTHVGYSTRFLFGCLERAVQWGLLPPERTEGVAFERVGSRHLTAAIPGLPVLHLYLERDLLVVSTRPDAVDSMLHQLASFETTGTLSKRQLFRRTVDSLGEARSDAALLAFVDTELLVTKGIDLEHIVTTLLGADARTVLFESVDFSAWRAIGLLIPAAISPQGNNIELAVSLDPDGGRRGAKVVSVYGRQPTTFDTVDLLPEDYAFAKTASLPFDTFFSLIFENLDEGTRKNVNYYVLDQLQTEAATLNRGQYVDLIGYLARNLGDEFTLFASPARFETTDELAPGGYYPKFGVIFSLRNSQAIRDLVLDVATVLPKLNPEIFSVETVQPQLRDGVLVFQVQSERSLLDIFYKMTPTFLVSDRYVVLVTRAEMVEPMLAAMTRKRPSNAPAAAPADSLVSARGDSLHELLADGWMGERQTFLAMEDVYRGQVAQQLIKERMAREGKVKLSGDEQDLWTAWANDIIDRDPSYEEKIQGVLRQFLEPKRQAFMQRIAWAAYLERVSLAARYTRNTLFASLWISFRAPTTSR